MNYFATLGDGIWFLVFVRTHTKVLDRLPGVLPSAQEDSVGTSRSPQSKLIKSQSFTAGIQNALLGCASESESSNREFWDSRETDIVSNNADCNNSFRVPISSVGCLLDDFRERNWRPVDFREEQSVKNDLDGLNKMRARYCLSYLVEFGVCTTRKESVQLKKNELVRGRSKISYLDEEQEVRILALWGRAVPLLDVVGSNVDTLQL